MRQVLSWMVRGRGSGRLVVGLLVRGDASDYLGARRGDVVSEYRTPSSPEEEERMSEAFAALGREYLRIAAAIALRRLRYLRRE